VLPGVEQCNGADDDCDGVADNAEGVGEPCSVGIGLCRREGQTVCAPETGEVVCGAVPGNAKEEACNGLDDDCDGVADEDEQGEALAEGCYGGPPGSAGLGRCQQGRRACSPELGGWGPCEGEVLPGAEICNGVDDDCNDRVDDVDGLGEPCSAGIGVCRVAGSRVCDLGSGELVCDATPGVSGPESCNSLDDDCDGATDEAEDGDPLREACYEGPPGTEGVAACEAGLRTCRAGRMGPCEGDVLPGQEICDGLDNDCNEQIDDVPGGCGCEPGEVQDCYAGPPGTGGVGACRVGSQRCGDDRTFGPCEGQVLPVDEVCNGEDDDCNDRVDDAAGLGDPCTSGVGACQRPGWLECPADGSPELSCSATPGPADEEVCNGVDDDCDELVDEDAEDQPLTEACYEGPAGTDGVGACEPGVRTCSEGRMGRCLGQLLPGFESCNGADDDCDGQTDELPRLGEPCWLGVGSCRREGRRVCDGVAGEIVCDATPGPTEPEMCNGLDDDCDGRADEGDDEAPLHELCYDGPAPSRGLGVCRDGERTCERGVWSLCREQVLPGQEICDGLDNDCDDDVDDTPGGCDCLPGDERDCYAGPEGSQGVGICRGGVQTCDADGAYGPCDGQQLPQPEVCNGADDDCNDTVDDAPGAGELCADGIGGCRRQGQRICDLQAGAVLCNVEAGLPEPETCDGVDNDCDTETDEPDEDAQLGGVCYAGDEETRDVGDCRAGVQHCVDGELTACLGEVLPTEEICDGRDNDCDGEADEGLEHAVECECLRLGEGDVGEPDDERCCPGLVALESVRYGADGDACMPGPERFLCAACGDGRCDPEHENPCSCAADCPWPLSSPCRREGGVCRAELPGCEELDEAPLPGCDQGQLCCTLPVPCAAVGAPLVELGQQCCEGLQQLPGARPTPWGCRGDQASAVCGACGDDLCGPGENRCNCPGDCPPGANPCVDAGALCRPELLGCLDGRVALGLAGCADGEQCCPDTGLCGLAGDRPGAADACCDGLASLPEVEVLGFEQCAADGEQRVCSPCGDGRCQLDWETPCSCPADCHWDAGACAAAGGSCQPLGQGCPEQAPEALAWSCAAGEICCLQPEICLAAGRTARGVELECCEGLAPVPLVVGVGEGCVEQEGASVCTACGDGVCDPWENACSCPDDCRDDELCTDRGGRCAELLAGCAPEETVEQQIGCAGERVCCTPPSPCVAAGEELLLASQACCQGLLPLREVAAAPNDCQPAAEPLTCSACGDRICDAWEDRCSCDVDCAEQGRNRCHAAQGVCRPEAEGCPGDPAPEPVQDCAAGELCCEMDHCVAEGAVSVRLADEPPLCCDGLVAIDVARFERGRCDRDSGAYVCSRCGDGVCQAEWESPCTCPGDCPWPTCAELDGQCTDDPEGCSAMLAEVALPGCPQGSVCCLGSADCLPEGVALQRASDRCCDDLEPLPALQVVGDQCVALPGLGVCASCGDQRCELGWESHCSCPADCPDPAPDACGVADGGCYAVAEGCPDSSTRLQLPGCLDEQVCCTEPAPCVPAGGFGTPGFDHCCEGLSERPPVEPGDPACGQQEDLFMCVPCGDGACQAGWENHCSCPADCLDDGRQ